jgi:formate dehydrogenase subunit delta
MNAQKLVKMANEIAAFFDAEPDRRTAVDGVAAHIKRFWDPRMRRELVQWIDDHAGEGCKETVLEAIKTHRGTLVPHG